MTRLKRISLSTLLLGAACLLTAGSATAQQGLISGWVIAVEDDSGQPQSDVFVAVASEAKTITIGSTAADGLIEIPFADVDIADGTNMDLELITVDGQMQITLTPAGERSEACQEAGEGEGDDCDVIGGYLTWGRSGRYTVSTSGNVSVVDTPSGDAAMPGSDHADSPVCVEVGAHLGRNVDFKEGFFGIDGRAYLHNLPYPIAIDVILSYYPVNEYFKAFAPSFYGSWVFDAAEKIEVSAGLGFEFFRSSFEYEGSESFSNTSTGFGVRFEGRYQLNEKISPVIDAVLLKFEGGTEFRLKFGARVKVFC